MSASATLAFIAEAARWAWTTSLIVSLPALLLLVLGRWQGFPPRARWLVGAALVLRLLLPGVPEFPGMNWVPTRHLAIPAVPTQEEIRAVSLVAASDDAPVRDASPRRTSLGLQQFLPAGWAVGVIAMFAWIGFSHRVIRRRIAGSAQVCTDERVQRHLLWAAQRIGVKHPPRLMVMPALSTVALSGWRRPCILVPPDLYDRFSAGELRGIFLHELAHVRRHDVMWTWLALAASALHWFNPLVWLMARRFRADRELECDRIALTLLDEPQRRHFGEALLKTLEAHQWPAVATVVPFALHQPEIRTRILMITRPHPAAWTRLIACIAAPCLVLLALGNAAADGEKEPAKAGEGDGVKKSGLRDGEGTKKTGAKDGENTNKTGLRDGEGAKKGKGDAEGGAKKAAREGEGAKKTGGEGQGARKGTGAAPSGNAVVIRVLGTGETVSVDGKSMAANELRAYLSDYLPDHAGSAVAIESDDNAPYKSVAEALDAARDNGAKKASIRTK